MQEVMLFPLSSIVLPEGKMRLRVFEARYKRLVVEALKGDGTFGICLFQKQASAENSELSVVGTLVKIVDFEQLDDGLLGITVTGLHRFMIRKVRTEHDGLRFAKIEPLANWPLMPLSKRGESLSQQLQQVYAQFEQLDALYDQKFFDDECWVSQRWLEILPLSNKQFDLLALELDCTVTIEYLSRALINDEQSDLDTRL
ncbi:LON peptidase substrate-binding domain-containing protein [Vibrio sinaloensis]|uniref:ATP-dependent protease n=1 Tax=Photobacterium sp. (strain ATCC 43367) TaxID=379097 RepID=A0A0A5JL14_PHOS4|nr:LON peptidase substrate-binding domain-containing protein [Vibrio sinaloensis]KGY08623.1 ATP-dependent protease [Vibrio sinaloensis]